MPKHIPELLAGCRIEKSNNWSEMLGCVCSCCHAKWFPLIYWRSKKKVGWGVHTSLSVGLVSMWRCTVSKLHVAFHFIVKRHQHLGQLCFLPPSAEVKIQFSYIEVWLAHLFFPLTIILGSVPASQWNKSFWGLISMQMWAKGETGQPTCVTAHWGLAYM